MSEDIFYIKNYQIIKNGKIKIRPGITLITGPSNNGKSSIFKAYKQIIYNLPGNTYINQFADQCELILDNDKYTIEYRKTKTKSSYDIKVVNPETTLHIDKLGVNQIDKIKELTHIDKELGYNFWDQLEKPFLLDRTNREQFLLLQESPISANLLNIQETIKTDIKTLKDEVLVSQGSLNVLNENINNYENILKNSAEINTHYDNTQELNKLNNKITDLNTKLLNLTNIEDKLNKINSVLNNNINIGDSNITEVYEKFNYFNSNLPKLISFTNQIKSIINNIEQTNNDITNITNIINVKFNVCPLCGNILHKEDH